MAIIRLTCTKCGHVKDISITRWKASGWNAFGVCPGCRLDVTAKKAEVLLVGDPLIIANERPLRAQNMHKNGTKKCLFWHRFGMK